jgi:hypothetical protein
VACFGEKCQEEKKKKGLARLKRAFQGGSKKKL